MKKENWYFCRYCNKKYHTFIEADLCMDLDIKTKIKNNEMQQNMKQQMDNGKTKKR